MTQSFFGRAGPSGAFNGFPSLSTPQSASGCISSPFGELYVYEHPLLSLNVGVGGELKSGPKTYMNAASAGPSGLANGFPVSG